MEDRAVVAIGALIGMTIGSVIVSTVRKSAQKKYYKERVEFWGDHYKVDPAAVPTPKFR